MPITRAGDIDIEYFVEGSGPPLLMIMGTGGSAHTWGQPFVDALNKHFTTIRLSNRGTGESAPATEQFTLRTLADDAKALLDVLGIDQVHLLGISLGGMIAQEFVLAYPERVNGLVLGCTTLGGPERIVSEPEARAVMVPDPNLSPEDVIRRSWYALVSDTFAAESHDFLEGRLVDFITWPVPMDTLIKQAVASIAFSSGDRVGAISAPTLVIHGDLDRLAPPVNGDMVAAAIPGATLHTMPSLGHMFFWEKPAESASVITSFLSRVPARA